MIYSVIIPAHNEAEFLKDCLDSLVVQTLMPDTVVIVNDNSSDDTEDLIDKYRAQHPFIQKVNNKSSDVHMPGSKVVNAFNSGLKAITTPYDFIVKLDADIILPGNYFEKISAIFEKHPKVGIAGGFAYEPDRNGNWKLNHPMDKNHVRGAFKSYTHKCFTAIGGLKNAMGWDTVDELLAAFHGFQTYTDDSLKVKHLRPLGAAYNQKAKVLQGVAMYTMRYGFWLTLIASVKMAFKFKNSKAVRDNLKGFFKAKKEQKPHIVSPDEGRFIRKVRWRNIKRKLF